MKASGPVTLKNKACIASAGTVAVEGSTILVESEGMSPTFIGKLSIAAESHVTLRPNLFLSTGNATVEAGGDVTLENPNGSATNADLTVSANNITVTGKGTGSMILGSAHLTAQGNVTLTGSKTLVGKNLTVAQATDVTLENTVGAFYLVNGALSVSATGDISFTGTEGGICASSADAGISGNNMTICGDGDGPLFCGSVTLTANGDVTLENKKGHLIRQGASIKAHNITLSGNADNAPLIEGAVTLSSKGGDIRMTNRHSYVCGGALTVTGARNVWMLGTAYGNTLLIGGAVQVEASKCLQICNMGTGRIFDGGATLAYGEGRMTYGAEPLTNTLTVTDPDARVWGYSSAVGMPIDISAVTADPAECKQLWICKTADTSVTLPIAAIDVTGGVAVSVGSIVAACEGTTVWLYANTAPEGMVFDRWDVESGNVTPEDPTSEATSFIMPAGNVTVRAVFKALPGTDTETDPNASTDTDKTPEESQPRDSSSFNDDDKVPSDSGSSHDSSHFNGEDKVPSDSGSSHDSSHFNGEDEASSNGSNAAVVAVAVTGGTVAVGLGGFSLVWFVLKKKTWAALIAACKHLFGK